MAFEAAVGWKRFDAPGAGRHGSGARPDGVADGPGAGSPRGTQGRGRRRRSGDRVKYVLALVGWAESSRPDAASTPSGLEDSTHPTRTPCPPPRPNPPPTPRSCRRTSSAGWRRSNSSPRKILAGRMKGDRLSKRKGRGSEFADFRPYSVGDDLRFLDWNLFGRLDKLFLRLFLEEEDLHVYLLIDNSRSMDFGTPTKLRYAKQVAAALGFVGLVNMDRVTIEAVGSRDAGAVAGLPRPAEPVADDEVPRRRPAGRRRRLQPRRCGRSACGRRGKGVAVVLSDFMDKGGYEDGLRYLAARNLDVYAIQVLAQEEIDPPYSRRPEADRRGGRRRGRGDGQRPAAGPLPADARRVPGGAERASAPGAGWRTCSPATRCRSSGWCWATCGARGLVR